MRNASSLFVLVLDIQLTAGDTDSKVIGVHSWILCIFLEVLLPVHAVTLLTIWIVRLRMLWMTKVHADTSVILAISGFYLVVI